MIAIVTDSSVHITRTEAQRLGVTVAPMTYTLPGQPALNDSYLDEDGDYASFVKESMGLIRTSQATYSAFVSDSGAT